MKSFRLLGGVPPGAIIFTSPPFALEPDENADEGKKTFVTPN